MIKHKTRLFWLAALLVFVGLVAATFFYYPSTSEPPKVSKEVVNEQIEKERSQKQASGTDEAGIDVSGIPAQKIGEEQGRCYLAYFESLDPSERGPEQQRITKEASERGILPPEVVGC